MANRSSFGPLVLVIAAMSCSLYVACGDDDVVIGNTAGSSGKLGRAALAAPAPLMRVMRVARAPAVLQRVLVASGVVVAVRALLAWAAVVAKRQMVARIVARTAATAAPRRTTEV